jgi:hypothetical protein
LRDRITYRTVEVVRGTESDAVPMTKSTKKAGLVVKSSVKSGGSSINHNRGALSSKKSGLVVKSTVKSGGSSINHNRRLLA